MDHQDQMKVERQHCSFLKLHFVNLPYMYITDQWYHAYSVLKRRDICKYLKTYSATLVLQTSARHDQIRPKVLQIMQHGTFNLWDTNFWLSS